MSSLWGSYLMKYIFLALYGWIYFLFWFGVFDRILLLYLHHSFINYIIWNFSFFALLVFKIQYAAE